MLVPDLPSRLDAAWGDPATWVANGLQWLHLDEVRALINRRVSGDPSVDSLQWLANHVAAAGGPPLQRVLVIGCGNGWVERALHERGFAREFVGFDLSPEILGRARAHSAHLPSIAYAQADMDKLPVGTAPFLPGTFDAVLGLWSVHHCSQIDNLYAAVASLLSPGGWFFLDEYVGPDRFQYTVTHLAQVRALIDLLPDRLLTTRSGQVRRGIRAPTVAEVVAVDPSEAARSASILPLLDQHFNVVAHRPYGGSLLHLVLAEVAQNFQPADARPWLQALLDAEDDLDRLGALEQHFSCVIARRRPAASGAPSPAR